MTDVDGGDDTGGEDEDRPLAVVDIDGVVADVCHRLHHLEGRRKDWGAFFAAAGEDPPLAAGRAVVDRLVEDHEVLFLTGRPEHLRGVTERWLDANGLGGHRLVMRPRGDHRPAAVLKVELLRRLAAGRAVAVVVDDDDLVLRAMASAGYTTFPARWATADEAGEAALQQAQEAEGRT